MLPWPVISPLLVIAPPPRLAASSVSWMMPELLKALVMSVVPLPRRSLPPGLSKGEEIKPALVMVAPGRLTRVALPEIRPGLRLLGPLLGRLGPGGGGPPRRARWWWRGLLPGGLR